MDGGTDKDSYQMDVRPKQFVDHTCPPPPDYKTVASIPVPNGTGSNSLKYKDASNTPAAAHRRRLASTGSSPGLPLLSPTKEKRIRNAHSTPNCEDGKEIEYNDGIPSRKKNTHKSKSCHNHSLIRKKSEDSIELMEEFDPAGPLLASSRKSLCVDNNNKDISNKKAGDNKGIKPLPTSETLVLNDEEFEQYVQLSQNMILQHQVKVKVPFPTGNVIYIRGREVILAIALFFFLTLSLGLVVAIARQRMSNQSSSSNRNTSTSAIKYSQTPKFMRDMGNFNLKPCDNFWEYACEGWLNNHEIPKNKNSWGVTKALQLEVNARLRLLLKDNYTDSDNGYSSTVLPSLEESISVTKAKTMYQQCMSPPTSTENILEIIHTIAGWFNNENMLYGFTEGTQKLIDAHWKYKTSVFFQVWVGTDDKASSEMIIQFDQGGLNLAHAEEYILNSTTIHYREYMKQFEYEQKIDQFASTTFNFEKQLAKLHIPEDSAERSDPDLTYNKITITKLTEICPQIDWLEFLRSAFPGVKPDAYVLITSEDYFKKLSNLLETTPYKVLRQYILWNIAFKYSNELSPVLQKAFRNYSKAISGIDTFEDRWEYCIHLVSDYMSAAVGALYVREYVSLDTITQLTKMLENLQSSFRKTMAKSNWMSKTTTKVALHKLDSLTHTIGYPSYILNNQVLNSLYSQFTVNNNDTFFSTLLNGITNEIYLMKQQLNTNEYPRRPDVSPHEVSAFYTWKQNMILIQSGILQPPHYHENASMVINYGAIGSIIGHEMVHGFDNMGGLFDAEGNSRPWWSTDSDMYYKSKQQCLEDQYSGYEFKGIHVNGEHTLAENIADLEGLKLAYKAWKVNSNQPAHKDPMQHSQEQLFFIAFAQNMCENRTLYDSFSMHAPAQMRVQGTLSNIAEFAKAFNCPAGSSFNPRNKCSIWD